MDEYQFLDLIEEMGFMLKQKLVNENLLEAMYEFGCMMGKIQDRILSIEKSYEHENNEKEDCFESTEKLCCKNQTR